MKTILGDLDLKKIAERLARTDEFILHVLAVRLAQGGLSDFVAINKAVAGKDGRWEYISVINKKVIEKQQNQEKHSSSEDKMIKEVEETFDKEFNAMRSEQQNKQ